ncbi:MAG: ion channel [Deltaproteobacteria bacterium]|nr:ion channel [Deltaproteobacteria bacterium]
MFVILFNLYRKFNIITLKHRSELLRILIILLAILLIFAFLFSHYEKISYFKAFYWAVTTASTVGYGDVTPTNNIGRVIAMGLMLVGIGMLGVFLATLSSIMFEFKLGRIFGSMESHFVEKHVVILGYSNLIKQSLDEILAEKDNITLVADIDKSPSNDINFVFIKGDITENKNIEKAKIDKAKLCIISDDDDSKTLISAITVRTKYKDTYIIALVVKKETARALKEIGVNEVFATGSFSSKLLVKSVKIRGASNFFSQLMNEDFEEGLIEKNIPSSIIGKSFHDALFFIKETTDELFVGVKRDGKMIVNPDGKTFILDKNDKMLLIGKK